MVMNKQLGFSTSIILLLLLVAGVVGFAGYSVFNKKDTNTPQPTNQATDAKVSTDTKVSAENKVSTEDKSNQKTCTSKPVAALPIDGQRIKSILYPGQVRGNNFKPHGGFILNGTNEASVTLPLDAKPIDGVRYIESGETQYMFDFEADCGYRFRLDHLNTLTSDMQKIADQLPQPTESSQTTAVNSGTISAGTVVATQVGFLKSKNTSFDFGFYDMNTQNTASKSSDWPQDFQHQTELATHGTCWFDYLSEKDAALIRSLPAGDANQGKTSAYCK